MDNINPYKIQLGKKIKLLIFANFVKFFVFIIFYFTFLLIIALNAKGHSAASLAQGLLITVAALGAVVFVLLFIPSFIDAIKISLYVKSLTYQFKEDSLYFKAGIISISEKNMPYSRIQHVVIYEDLLQKLGGLSTIIVQTASDFNAIVLPDLKKDEANIIKQFLIKKAEKSKIVAGI